MAYQFSPTQFINTDDPHPERGSIPRRNMDSPTTGPEGRAPYRAGHRRPRKADIDVRPSATRYRITKDAAEHQYLMRAYTQLWRRRP